MDEMAVDVEQAGAIRLLVDHVVVPDLVVEGAGLCHCSILSRGWQVFNHSRGGGKAAANAKREPSSRMRHAGKCGPQSYSAASAPSCFSVMRAFLPRSPRR